jgi:uncharacterized protein (DUF2141 family)
MTQPDQHDQYLFAYHTQTNNLDMAVNHFLRHLNPETVYFSETSTGGNKMRISRLPVDRWRIAATTEIDMLRASHSIVILTVLLTQAAFGDQSDTGATHSRIDVTIAPVRVDDGGSLMIALYDGEDTWLEMEKAFAIKTVPAVADTVNISFDSIAPGEYAISVVHDKNENGKFDMRWFPWPKPKEGSGVSNNHRRKGKPKFDKAKFTVGHEAKLLSIDMFY